MTNNLYDKFKNWSCIDGVHNNAIYFIGDTHFSDLDSYKYFRFPKLFTADCNVVETIKTLDKMQIDSINKICTKNDCLVILGDVGNIDCVKKLKAGYKVLIMGNHDAGASNYKHKCYTQNIDCASYSVENLNSIWSKAFELFKEDEDAQYDYVCKEKSLIRKKAIEDLRKNLDFKELSKSTYYDNTSPEFWEASYDNKLFDEIYEGSLQISPKIVLSHEPVDSKFCLNIHGHCHSGQFNLYSRSEVIERHIGTETIKYENTYYYYNCIAEGLNYKPISLKQIIESGCLKNIQDIHRATIDRATENKLIRGQSI